MLQTLSTNSFQTNTDCFLQVIVFSFTSAYYATLMKRFTVNKTFSPFCNKTREIMFNKDQRVHEMFIYCFNVHYFGKSSKTANHQL